MARNYNRISSRSGRRRLLTPSSTRRPLCHTFLALDWEFRWSDSIDKIKAKNVGIVKAMARRFNEDIGITEDQMFPNFK